MTPALVTELKRLEREATPLRWVVKSSYKYSKIFWEGPDGSYTGLPSLSSGSGDGIVTWTQNAQFIAELRNAAPALLEAVETMHAALEKVASANAHASGCGKIFEWPFSKEVVDGCNCGINNLFEAKICRDALARVAALLDEPRELLGEGREK